MMTSWHGGERFPHDWPFVVGIRRHKGSLIRNFEEFSPKMKMCSFYRHFHHWLYRKLWFWRLAVQPEMKLSSKWRHFCFSELALCDGNPPVTSGFPPQKVSNAELWRLFIGSLCKLLNRQSSCRLFETPFMFMWRHCNADGGAPHIKTTGPPQSVRRPYFQV